MCDRPSVDRPSVNLPIDWSAGYLEGRKENCLHKNITGTHRYRHVENCLALQEGIGTCRNPGGRIKQYPLWEASKKVDYALCLEDLGLQLQRYETLIQVRGKKH